MKFATELRGSLHGVKLQAIGFLAWIPQTNNLSKQGVSPVFDWNFNARYEDILLYN